MVKLLRFKYTDNTQSAQDVRGFGKQPITISPYSSIALKNYNIKLIATLNNMLFTIGEADQILFKLNGDGISLERLAITAGSYNYIQVVSMLQLAINSLLLQNTETNPRGFTTYVQLQAPQSSLSFTTTVNPVDEYPLADPTNFLVVRQNPGPVILANDIYDARGAAVESIAFICDGVTVDSPSDIMLGGDHFSFTIVNTGNITVEPPNPNVYGSFRIACCFGGNQTQKSLWGIGYTEGRYVYANNSSNELSWNVLGDESLEPEDEDIMSMTRSGTFIHIRINRGGNADFYYNSFNLSPNVINLASAGGYKYSIRTVSTVRISHIAFAMSLFTGAEGPEQNQQTSIQCTSNTLAPQLGFPSTVELKSDVFNPAEILLNTVKGSVNYEGIMVCINGLDLETYDFATLAEGKTNFLYTIQKSLDTVAINVALGDITNEPYIDMNNMGAMNVNNKLSLYFLDTASGRKLDFTYADLLLIVK